MPGASDSKRSFRDLTPLWPVGVEAAFHNVAGLTGELGLSVEVGGAKSVLSQVNSHDSAGGCVVMCPEDVRTSVTFGSVRLSGGSSP